MGSRSKAFEVEPIAVVSSSRVEPIDDGWDGETSSIVLADRFDESALDGLEAFSHIDVVYLFNQVAPDTIVEGGRHPRGNQDWPRVGIFAQRGKNRPNRIGVTTCRLLGVEGRVLAVVGLDAIDGTPVLDIKPYLREFGPRGEVRQPDWAHELMRGYWS
jgi:tRNA (adenine37-N6)-methyltransferase